MEEKRVPGPALEIRLFGQVQVHYDRLPLRMQFPARAFALLGYLLLHQGTPLARDSVAFTFWPDLAEDEARAKLRSHLHYLTTALPSVEGKPWILADRRTIEWNPKAPAWVDVVEFERLLKQPDGDAAAADLYTGDLLAAFDEEWIEGLRADLRQRQLAALLRLASDDTNLQAAAGYATRLLALDPWREDGVRALMTLRNAMGDRAAAIQTYRDFGRRIKAELGVEPTAETSALYERIATSQAAPPEPAQATHSAASAGPALLGGTATFLFTDIEGGTQRWEQDHQKMEYAVARHDAILRTAIDSAGGYVFKTIGDSLCVAFARAEDAANAAAAIQRVLAEEDFADVDGLRVRVALHSGSADERDGDYHGPAINRVSRLLSIGHGGQILVSGITADLLRGRLPAGTVLRDMGPHHLKSIVDAEQVFQLDAPGLKHDFPPLLSADARPNNLPSHLRELIGRTDEVNEIKSLISQSRLVTVTGAGGIGKTSTALQVAAQLLHEDGDGVWFVDLAPLDDAMLVPSAIAEVLNIADDGGSRRLIERICLELKSKRALIVLDSCEHVISAVADAAERLLQSCPHVRLLATSREPLGVAGEDAYRMPALPVPPEGEKMNAERVLRYGAAALFISRARAAQRNFVLDDGNAEIVAEIVRRLDGIALAIELAASRVKVLNLQQLTQRLDERFKLLTGGSRTALPRQQTLRALIGWSYDLLSEPEQSLLRSLAIFRGGWTLEAAEAICVDDRFPDWNVLDHIAALVDKSLVVVDDDESERRYRFLESTRQYALERLDAVDARNAAAARHCKYFAQTAQHASRVYWQTDSELWIAMVRQELENYRAAVGWGLIDGNDGESAAAIVGSLGHLWFAAARREGNMLLERAMPMLADDASAAVRGVLALAAAKLDYSANVDKPSEAAKAFAEVGDETRRAEALMLHSFALGRAGQIDASISYAEEALAVARRQNAPRLTGWILSIAALWVGNAGDAARARLLFEEAATLLRSCNDRLALGILQSNRADFIFCAEGDALKALECSDEAASIFRQFSSESRLGITLNNAAAYQIALDRFGEAWVSTREGLDIAVRTSDHSRATIAIGHLAHIAVAIGDLALGARLLGYTDAAYRRLGTKHEPAEKVGYDSALEIVRAKLPSEQVASLMAEGETMTEEIAVVEALAIPQPAGALTSKSA